MVLDLLGKLTPPLLRGSWDFVRKVISTLIGVTSIVTLRITLVTKSHDPLSNLVFVLTYDDRLSPEPTCPYFPLDP